MIVNPIRELITGWPWGMRQGRGEGGDADYINLGQKKCTGECPVGDCELVGALKGRERERESRCGEAANPPRREKGFL